MAPCSRLGGGSPRLLRLSVFLVLAVSHSNFARAEIDWVYSDPASFVQSHQNFESTNPTAEYWEGVIDQAQDPIVHLKPCEFDADARKFLYLDMAVEDAQAIQVFFSKEPQGEFSEGRSFRDFNLFRDPERTVFRIDLSEVEGWTGPIRALRVDIDGSEKGRWIRIYRIGVSETPVEIEGTVAVKISSDKYAGHIASTDPLSPEEAREKFILPPGFEIQLVAAEPDIQKPININFDAKGRLWVSSTVEYPYAVTDEAKARDTIRILEDFGPDGRARKVTVFAENLVIPSGVMPVEGGAIVWSIPNVYRFHDDDGDDKADRKEHYFGPFECKDTHGNVSNFEWSDDGWVYANHGFANVSKVSGRDGHEIRMASGHTWRFRPDGSRVELVGLGQVNPFGIAFDPMGNLYTADCHSKPVYQILHGASYPTFSAADLKDGLGYGPSICEHSHGSTAICGVAYYDDIHFPEEFRRNVFIGNAVTSRVNRDLIDRAGGTYTAVLKPDFIRSKDPWFRPVNVKLGPDGALYIADFYNSIIGHYEVPLDHPGRDRDRGRIWRVVYTGEGAGREVVSPRDDWTAASNDELIEDLGHPNGWIRRTAVNQLASREADDAAPLIERMLDSKSASPLQRLHGLWVLHRLGELESDHLKQDANHADLRVRVHVQRILAERAGWSETERRIAIAGLEDPDPLVRRNAAEALRRHPAPGQVFSLLDALKATPEKDLGLTHVVRMSARDQLNLEESWAHVLGSPHLHYYRAVLGESIAVGSPTPQAARFLMDYLESLPFDPSRFETLVKHVSRHGGEEEAARLYRKVRDQAGEDLGNQFHFLKAVNEGVREKGKKLPEDFRSWAESLAGNCLASENEETVFQGLDLIQSLRLELYVPELESAVKSADLPSKRRARSAEALLEIDFGGRLPLVGEILDDPDESLEARESMCNAIGKYRKDESVEVLAASLQSAPWDLAVPIAYQLSTTDIGASRLIGDVSAGKASVQLLGERRVAERLSNHRSIELEKKVSALTEGMPSIEEQVAQLISQRRESFHSASADPDKGMAVFEKNCAACHRIGDLGQRIGPELDGIGNRGLDRILEDTLDPSRNVDQAYLASLIELDSGEFLTGLRKGEEGEVVLLADAQGEIIRISKEEIVDERQSKLSPMPSNLGADLNEEDFRNLMAFLLKQRVED